MTRPVALTPGDAAGVGPEVGARAAAALLAEGVEPGALALVGDPGLWELAAALLPAQARAALATVRRDPVDPASDPAHAHLPEIGAVATAAGGCLLGRYGAVCTGPIHKADLLRRVFPFAGHTGYLAHLCGRPQDDAVMGFFGGTLAVVLATVHVPLRAVPDRLDAAAIQRAARAGAAFLMRDGVARPRVAICGLNPHAGEDGALGDEEGRVVGPAVAALRAEGLDATGPLSADTLFGRAARGEFDLVVALYHDQGLIPVKTLDFGRSVNVTLGLPLARTSVDHGTARDVAWTGRADHRPTEAALRLALRLARGAAPAP